MNIKYLEYIRNNKTIWFICILVIFSLHLQAAYLENIPITIYQPDGEMLTVYLTGDEFYNWVHNEQGYTIVKNKNTGYYCYAILNNDELVSSPYIVGKIDPSKTTLVPFLNISDKAIQNKRKEYSIETSLISKGITGLMNNLVIYIRFADQEEFPATQSTYSSMFNGENVNSLKCYFKEVSYNQLSINSTFYPLNDGCHIISYQAPRNRNYYCPYDSISNPSGYKENERRQREQTLLAEAIEFVKAQIPNNLNIDYDNDGNIDNVCFIIKGGTSLWNSLLWPHRWSFTIGDTRINGKKLVDYNLQIESYLNVAVLCHEMGHTLGAPDLYQASQYGTPVGIWSNMATSSNPPRYMGAFINYKYTKWISSISEITTSGRYILNPLSSPTMNCYKIPLAESSEYLVLEYRKKMGIFEEGIPHSGLLIYRINESYRGNFNGNGFGGSMDEIYIFRPDGTLSSNGHIDEASFSDVYDRTVFNSHSNPACFISNGETRKIYINNIQENADGTLSFDLSFCDGDVVSFTNTNNLPPYTKVSQSITTHGNVVVKSTDRIIFEAGSQIILNRGFKVEPGGAFKAVIEQCQ